MGQPEGLSICYEAGPTGYPLVRLLSAHTTRTYAKILKSKGLTGSHSRRGNCYDNACVESFFSHLKTEKLNLEKPENLENAEHLLTEYINYYNNERFQKKLGDLSPVEYRQQIAA